MHDRAASIPAQRPYGLLSSLYVAQGLPFGFFSLALPVLMREAGWSLTAIQFLQLLALPWALKFLWAPVVDRHGRRRTWLLGLQAAGVVMALLMSVLDLEGARWPLFVAVALFNLIAATQDIVTDGLAVRLLDGRSRGLANGIQVGAYRVGMILGGGLLLWVFAQAGWSAMFVGMAVLLALTSVAVWHWQEPPEVTSGLSDDPAALTGGVSLGWAWLQRALTPQLLTMAALVLVYRFGDQMVSALITPFLLDQGVSKAQIAVMKGTVGSVSSLVGAALGGWMMLHLSRRVALLGTGLAQAASFGLYIGVALGWGGHDWLWAATVAEGVVGTMASVALFALMMDAADPRHAGTDYSLLASAVVAVGGVGGLAGGVVGDHLGYGVAFGAGTVLSALGCVGLVAWLDRRPLSARLAERWR